ncbi:MAG TPA: hypothetical protein VLC92_19430 [Rhodocyclaceae bacterium]|nr:hypothetical protein [Rhodocyclaceae bacterium]
MRTTFQFLALLIALLASSVRAADAHEIVLGPQDKYEVAETSQWSVEVVREVGGHFADVKIKPRRGTAFVLTLYFLSDPKDIARHDSREKIATSVKENAERFLGMTVEKSVTLQTVAPRGSYGSLVVLTAANLKGDPEEFKYQTRGMVRLSPDAALGFGLLSKEINTAAYRQWLAYIYSFIKLAPSLAAEPVKAPASEKSQAPTVQTAPAAIAKPEPVSAPVPVPERAPAAVRTPQPVPTPAPIAKPEPVAVPAPAPERPPAAVRPAQAAPAPAQAPAKPVPRGPQRDMRECLKLPTDAEIMRCANGGK